jgi:hypothetical protein
MNKKSKEWTVIPEFNGKYFINKRGSIKNGEDNSIMQQHRFKTDDGLFKTVFLNKHGRACRYFVHRLVADTFLPKVNGYYDVYHLNGNTTDNNLCNLIWIQ